MEPDCPLSSCQAFLPLISASTVFLDWGLVTRRAQLVIIYVNSWPSKQSRHFSLTNSRVSHLWGTCFRKRRAQHSVGYQPMNLWIQFRLFSNALLQHLPIWIDSVYWTEPIRLFQAEAKNELFLEGRNRRRRKSKLSERSEPRSFKSAVRCSVASCATNREESSIKIQSYTDFINVLLCWNEFLSGC